MQQHILKNHSQSQSPEPLNEEQVMARQVSSRMQECPPSDMAQDSGMVTMITSKVAGVDNIDNFKMGDLIESGEFESIYKATCINSGKEVAVKMIDKQHMLRFEK